MMNRECLISGKKVYDNNSKQRVTVQRIHTFFKYLYYCKTENNNYIWVDYTNMSKIPGKSHLPLWMIK